jgi:hypothetical protein
VKRLPGPASQSSNASSDAVTETKRRSDVSPIAATAEKAIPPPASGRAKPAATASAAARP